MERLTVWAPLVGRVEVDLPETGQRLAIDALPDGWWQLASPLPHGTDYAFCLDGADPVPDPRSPWQPEGVHGASRRFDTSLFEWSDARWPGVDVLGAVLYELHVGTFTPTGTLDSAIERLDHLADLGVELVQLMPVTAFPGRYGWGYDGVDLYAVHEPYGGPEALQRFVDAAHGRGLGVSLDVVYNHLGPSGNYLGRFGPYFTDRHHTPWGEAVNLDAPDARPVRDFIIDNALRWLRDFHLDALRLDAVHALVDGSEVHLLAELSTAVKHLSADLGRPLSLIAESDLNDVAMVTPIAEGGLGMTAQWDDDVHHAIHSFLTGEQQGYYADFCSMDVLHRALSRVFVHDGGYSTFRGRDWGASVPDDVSGHRFVVFASNHDQVGNRALGDRPSRVLDTGQLAISAALVLTGPFTPMLFMGEEWGACTPWLFFTDHSEPELAKAIREGRRREFADHGWEVGSQGRVEVPDPQSVLTARRSILDWTEPQIGEHGRLLEFYRRLIELRRSVPDLGSGDRRAMTVQYHAHLGWMLIRRGSVRIVLNTSDEDLLVPLPGADSLRPRASWAPFHARTDLTFAGVRVPRHGVVLVDDRGKSTGYVSGP